MCTILWVSGTSVYLATTDIVLLQDSAQGSTANRQCNTASPFATTSILTIITRKSLFRFLKFEVLLECTQMLYRYLSHRYSILLQWQHPCPQPSVRLTFYPWSKILRPNDSFYENIADKLQILQFLIMLLKSFYRQVTL